MTAITNSEPLISTTDDGVAEIFVKDPQWIPDIMIMDSEINDFAALSILNYLNKNLIIYVQIPTTNKFFTSKDKQELVDYHKKRRHIIFEDKHSTNQKALKLALDKFIKKIL